MYGDLPRGGKIPELEASTIFRSRPSRFEEGCFVYEVIDVETRSDGQERFYVWQISSGVSLFDRNKKIRPMCIGKLYKEFLSEEQREAISPHLDFLMKNLSVA
jgi:hypothetical protein